jgi:hypothetical protein
MLNTSIPSSVFSVRRRSCIVQLSDRFGDDEENLRKYRELQDMLIIGNAVLDTVDLYPELNVEQLIFELKMFRNRFTYKTVTVAEAVELVRGMVPEVRQLFVSVTELRHCASASESCIKRTRRTKLQFP